MSSKLAFSNGFFMLSSNCQKRPCGRLHSPCRMEMQSKPSLTAVREEDPTKLQRSPISPHVGTLRSSNYLQFTKLQPLDREIDQERRYFGEFVAREAILDEEYWTAAWLRAETHWEDRPNERYADNYRRQFAEQEFNALKRRCKGYHGQRLTCIVAVKKDDKNTRNTIIKSVVGTLDLSIRSLFQGESFPGERAQAPLFCGIEREEESRYGYVANLCVAKSARRKGIAINMLMFAIESANSKGVERVFVHVNRKNTPAQGLYQKLGFEIVDAASPQLEEEQMYLLSFKT